MSIAPTYLFGAPDRDGASGGGDGEAAAEDMTPEIESLFQDERAEADARLLRRMAGGDRDALAELYDRFSRPLFATALRILNDPSEAQDVTHDAFLALWEKAGTFASARGTAFSWAVTLTRNRAIDRLRSRRRRARLLDESLPGDLGYGDGPAGRGADADAVLNDEAGAARAALAALPRDQRQAVELAFFGGLTQQEIAERLKEPLGTVKARIRRGLHRLRDTLARRP
jgi:RNA polymerase sigma-70 factor (ECF subfamily)